MIKAIILDCFGVLVTDKWQHWKNQRFAGDQQLLDEINRLNSLTDSGEISYEAFVEKVAQFASEDIATIREIIEHQSVNDELIHHLLATYKTRYKVGLLSNTPVNWIEQLFSAQQRELFDEVVLSCEVGVAKPSPAIYRIILARLGAEPHEALYIDDQSKNCLAAENLGLQVIHYTNNDDLQTKIAELNV